MSNPLYINNEGYYQVFVDESNGAGDYTVYYYYHMGLVLTSEDIEAYKKTIPLIDFNW